MSASFIVQPPSRLPRADALAPFAEYIDDPDVTDIFVNGQGGLFVDRGSGAEHVPQWRASEREIRALASSLIADGGRHVDDASPLIDVRLREGIRVHAVLAPIATSGTSLSIRVPRVRQSTLADLAAAGSLDPATERFLRGAVARRANFLISGAAGAGKTTLLAALLSEAAPTERIVTIEDVAELVIRHPHHVALESRQANLEGAGAIGLDRLVREALRMRPDRLVIGECRGAEVRELLTALNTGHDGGAGTVHANSLADVASRLEALGALAGLDDAALARQVLSAMEFVAHVEVAPSGVRRVAAVGRFGLDGGRLSVEPIDVAGSGGGAWSGRSAQSGGGAVHASEAYAGATTGSSADATTGSSADACAGAQACTDETGPATAPVPAAACADRLVASQSSLIPPRARVPKHPAGGASLAAPVAARGDVHGFVNVHGFVSSEPIPSETVHIDETVHTPAWDQSPAQAQGQPHAQLQPRSQSQPQQQAQAQAQGQGQPHAQLQPRSQSQPQQQAQPRTALPAQTSAHPQPSGRFLPRPQPGVNAPRSRDVWAA